ncbi:hypothetical protein DWF00_13050 [Bosea caraganae]|uniref:Uncharacterized protein n=1 Tax=Bosea caraganae TaxID=2763117 RepID=A0A370L167_9HYPH|nr:hypothetical protein [Bosea caraganae]RDJ21245.1 hypothetical protein DWE98_21215 [Bosea caraganae]RDJ26385.1 hypothetical protein DWF00_13050 [Bosea caraganae]
MPNALVIEVASTTAGIVAGSERGFRFYSSTPEFEELDGRIFRSPAEATRAAILHSKARPSRKAA